LIYFFEVVKNLLIIQVGGLNCFLQEEFFETRFVLEQVLKKKIALLVYFGDELIRVLLFLLYYLHDEEHDEVERKLLHALLVALPAQILP
jgi:hypothetical protein